MAIGPLASEPGAPPVCSLRTIKSDVVVGIPNGVGEKLDEDEPGWKISGKYVGSCLLNTIHGHFANDLSRLSFSCPRVDRERSLSTTKKLWCFV
jgi:hypothetical protein